MNRLNHLYKSVESYVSNRVLKNALKSSSKEGYYELVNKQIEQDRAVESGEADKFGELICYKHED